VTSPGAVGTAVGFVGLGQIGAPMAGHLVDWPGGLVVCDVRAEAVAPFTDAGAAVAATPSELAASCPVVSVMVRDDDQVRDVVTGSAGLLAGARPGTVVAVHSTIRPGTAEALAREASDAGVALVDAPVSGGFMGAHEGTLAVMVGGEDGAVEACRGPFALWSSLFVHCGPVGSATRMKLARNLMHFTAFTAASEAQRLAEAAGLDVLALGEVVRHSDRVTGGPGAVMIRPTAAALAADDPLRAVFAHTAGLGEKDLDLALELAASLGVDLPLAALARDRLAGALGVPHEEVSP